MSSSRAYRIQIKGIVQGVGFRPFIHRLVREYCLAGSIRNTSSGVTLELEGEDRAIDAFLKALPKEAPPLSVIESISREEIPLQGFEGFNIISSERQDQRNTLISPDISICPDCLRELQNPADRRYRFPFINCTNCGPRFTIIEDIPYDRAKTSMKGFPMCADCDAEYHDIENRRYHAQPDCCPVCGPKLSFRNATGEEQAGNALLLARRSLREGKILAVKGLGGFHLACRCDDPDIALTLRRRKHRDEKPFAVMCRDTEAVRKICELSAEEEKILTGARKPIVLLKKRVPKPETDSSVYWHHLSENSRIGVMLPYTPLHVLLMEAREGEDEGFEMLIMTSANLSDTPIMRENEEAVSNLRGIADGFLLHNRRIQTRCDDSLCWVLEGKEYFARRSRGYVPQPVTVPPLHRHILACGAEQKASFCLGKEEHAFLSQHIGDLKNLETLEHYEAQIRHFERLFDIHPEILACDLHPDYLSTEYARRRADEDGIPLLQVQHHHAHMAACMSDNGLNEPCIGLLWDGTGLGTDGTSWGAECLIGDYRQFRRAASIRPIPLIGGDRAAEEPFRVAMAMLREAGCDDREYRFGRPDTELGFLRKQLDAGLNCPLSSGMGRLFDGVSALLGIREISGYEGQAAILLEAAAAETERCFPVVFCTEKEEGFPRFDWRPMTEEIWKLQREGAAAPELAGAFLNTMAELAVQMAVQASKESGIRKVLLSGGTFQNQFLMKTLPKRLRRAGLEPFYHGRVSCNDEGLSLGQLLIAEANSPNGL